MFLLGLSFTHSIPPELYLNSKIRERLFYSKINCFRQKKGNKELIEYGPLKISGALILFPA